MSGVGWVGSRCPIPVTAPPVGLNRPASTMRSVSYDPSLRRQEARSAMARGRKTEVSPETSVELWPGRRGRCRRQWSSLRSARLRHMSNVSGETAGSDLHWVHTPVQNVMWVWSSKYSCSCNNLGFTRHISTKHKIERRACGEDRAGQVSRRYGAIRRTSRARPSVQTGVGRGPCWVVVRLRW